jgi:asparagine synthase (glutamine-hydrolysing)
MIFSKDEIKIEKYWELEEEHGLSKERIKERLNSAISLRMRSDVEVGSLLSGGIDSSTILGIINQQEYATEFQTFSAVFKEREFSEKSYIDEFNADNIELKKHFIYPKAEDLVNIIDELIYTQEEPFRSLAVFSQYEIYRNIKKRTDVTVLLNGQGADEIFTGYTEYYYLYLLELLRTFKLKLFIQEVKHFKLNRNLDSLTLIKQLIINLLSGYIRPSDKYKIFNRKFNVTKNKKKFANLLKDGLYKNLSFSALREYLHYEDRNSMRFSLESRLPFLDFKLVQSAFGLDDKHKIESGLSKVVLRDIARNKIPNGTLNRKDKMGFVSPQEVWQKTLLKDDLDSCFLEIEREGIFDFIDRDRLTKVYIEYKEGRFDDWAFIWRVYCLYRWKKVWRVNEE